MIGRIRVCGRPVSSGRGTIGAGTIIGCRNARRHHHLAPCSPSSVRERIGGAVRESRPIAACRRDPRSVCRPDRVSGVGRSGVTEPHSTRLAFDQQQEFVVGGCPPLDLDAFGERDDNYHGRHNGDHGRQNDVGPGSANE